MDSCSKRKRSEIMSKIKHENTAPELSVRKYLFSRGFRYRTNVRSLPGSPDIVLKNTKPLSLYTVVFGMDILVEPVVVRKATRRIGFRNWMRTYPEIIEKFRN